MTTSRKIVIALCAVILGYQGFLFIEERNAKSVVKSVQTDLAVGDPEEKVVRVLRERGLEPRLEPQERRCSAVIRLRHGRQVLMVITFDLVGKVAGVEIKSRVLI